MGPENAVMVGQWKTVVSSRVKMKNIKKNSELKGDWEAAAWLPSTCKFATVLTASSWSQNGK